MLWIYDFKSLSARAQFVKSSKTFYIIMKVEYI